MIMKQKTPSAVLAALWISAAAVLGLSACATQPTQESDITLYVFHCGNIESRDVSLFSPGVNQGQSKQLTNSCYLIYHSRSYSEGVILDRSLLRFSLGSEVISILCMFFAQMWW